MMFELENRPISSWELMKKDSNETSWPLSAGRALPIWSLLISCVWRKMRLGLPDTWTYIYHNFQKRLHEFGSSLFDTVQRVRKEEHGLLYHFRKKLAPKMYAAFTQRCLEEEWVDLFNRRLEDILSFQYNESIRQTQEEFNKDRMDCSWKTSFCGKYIW